MEYQQLTGINEASWGQLGNLEKVQLAPDWPQIVVELPTADGLAITAQPSISHRLGKHFIVRSDGVHGRLAPSTAVSDLRKILTSLKLRRYPEPYVSGLAPSDGAGASLVKFPC